LKQGLGRVGGWLRRQKSGPCSRILHSPQVICKVSGGEPLRHVIADISMSDKTCFWAYPQGHPIVDELEQYTRSCAKELFTLLHHVKVLPISAKLAALLSTSNHTKAPRAGIPYIPLG